MWFTPTALHSVIASGRPSRWYPTRYQGALCACPCVTREQCVRVPVSLATTRREREKIELRVFPTPRIAALCIYVLFAAHRLSAPSIPQFRPRFDKRCAASCSFGTSGPGSALALDLGARKTLYGGGYTSSNKFLLIYNNFEISRYQFCCIFDALQTMISFLDIFENK